MDNVSKGAISSYTFSNVTTNHTISATFAQDDPDSHTITASARANGSISPSGSVTVNHGVNQTFYFNANSVYEVSNVNVDYVSQGVIEYYRFSNVTEDHSISVYFKEKEECPWGCFCDIGDSLPYEVQDALGPILGILLLILGFFSLSS